MGNEIDLKEYLEHEIRSLKEFINEKFINIQDLQGHYNREIEKDVNSAHEKIRQQDEKIKSIEKQVVLLEHSTHERVSGWKKIQESFWGWLIPFIFMAVLFAISKGFVK